jgi:hypothetical protein
MIDDEIKRPMTKLPALTVYVTITQVCLSGRVVDPDPDPYWIRIQLGLWIRIRIRIRNTDPDPDPGGKK